MKITSSWSEILRVNEAVESFLRQSGVATDNMLRQTMIACELVENAIKYGHFRRLHDAVILRVSVSESQVLVQVTNPVHHGSNTYLAELDRTIQWTRGFQDPFEAFVERMKAISGEPLELSKSCLGIVRIAYEGRAALDFFLDDDGTLSVSALSTVA